jgi:hypothetical protein
MKYRKVWEKINGPIPKDDLGRSYEIHHIDGNIIFESGRMAAKYYNVTPATIVHWIKIKKLVKYH